MTTAVGNHDELAFAGHDDGFLTFSCVNQLIMEGLDDTPSTNFSPANLSLTQTPPPSAAQSNLVRPEEPLRN